MSSSSPVLQTSLDVLAEAGIAPALGQCRAMPVRLSAGETAVLLAHAADFDIDPSPQMFFFPTDTLKLTLLGLDGRVRWQRDLGRAVIPGLWFCPVLAMDLDEAGGDQVWFVDQPNRAHPLDPTSMQLVRLDADTGEPTGAWPWPVLPHDPPFYQAYRNFLLGGRAGGKPVLVCAQGTYSDMMLQGHGPGMEPLWSTHIRKADPGARGSHQCAVVDIDGDGDDEVLWGERCIRLRDGGERFCADRNTYRGHSDIAQPVLDRCDGTWRFFVCREGDPAASPRVLAYDADGKRLWGHVEEGHIDMGWTAHVEDGTGVPRRVCAAIRIGLKTCGPDGRFHDDRQEFFYDFDTGEPIAWPFSAYRMMPVDINGDGYHEFVRGVPGGDGLLLDARGRTLGQVDGTVALIGHFANHPGEQLLTFTADGHVRIWADANACDHDAALERYSHAYYANALRLGGTGYNLGLLGGL